MTFKTFVHRHYEGALPEAVVIARSCDQLAPYGFSAENTIACVAICRDELCTPFKSEVRKVWGEAFNMASLAGVTFCGVTGFQAAHAHAPTGCDRERYAYYSMVHIGVGADGAPGACVRAGRSDTSTACGALTALLAEIHGSDVPLEYDPDDMEQSQLRHRLLRRVGWGAKPDLFALTEAARVEALETFERMIALTVDGSRADYALINGVQIHGPEETWVWPGVSYAMVEGVRHDLDLHDVTPREG